MQEKRVNEYLTNNEAKRITGAKNMKLYSETSLSDFNFWSGAKDNASRLTSSQLDTVEYILEDLYPEGMGETSLNDLFWFNFDAVKEWLGISDSEEEEEEINE